MADLIKYFAFALVIPVIFAIGHCGKAGCNTIVYPAKPYSGLAVSPYMELGKLETKIWQCGSFTCSVAVVVKPWLHNPLDKPAYAVVSCSYWVDDLKLDTRSLKPVLVPARSSVHVEVHHGVTILRQRSNIGIDCDATFSGYAPGNTYVAEVVTPPAMTDEDVGVDETDDSTEVQDVAL